MRTGHCPVSVASGHFPEAEVRYVESARLDGESFIELVEVTGAQAKDLIDAARAEVVEHRPGRTLCRVTMRGACLRAAIAREGAIPLEVRVRNGHETASVLVRDAAEARALVDALRVRYEGVELLRMAPFDSSRSSAPEEELTPRQQEILAAAVAGGYFAQARPQTAGELAKSLGIDRSTFTRQLRCALRKVLAAYAR